MQKRSLFSLFLLLVFLGACQAETAMEAHPTVTSTGIRNYLTATLHPSSTPLPSPTITPTATPTPTPTPAAPVLSVVGLAPRAYTLFDPVSVPGAACGYADTLDFPLQPPDGVGAYGGRDYNVYRDRYEKFHAGEDWGLGSRNNLGQPVYSIGHGQVTYAAPEGWGLDKGVVIILHTFPDGNWFYSFYGHLDPESVVLRQGDCVWRGDPLGEIGQPRTPPHLHFEIRTILPSSPGPGYWSTNPTRAGWLPPSQTISEYRMQVSPGVLWTRPAASERSIPLGLLDGLYLVVEDEWLLAIDLESSRAVWTIELGEDFRVASVDLTRRIFYQYRLGTLEAYALPAPDAVEIYSLDQLWTQAVSLIGLPRLLILPSGGLFLSDTRSWRTFSDTGELLWEQVGLRPVSSWAQTADALLLAISSGENTLWTVTEDGVQPWDLSVVGRPIVAGAQAWLYANEGVYQLDLEQQQAELRYRLPSGFARRSDAAPLPDGGLLVAHSDPFDSRLLAFNPDGSLRWEYSYASLGGSTVQLALQAGLIYVLVEPSGSSVAGQYAVARLYRLDPGQATLTLIFEGGSRNPGATSTWIEGVSLDRFYLEIGGGASVLLSPQSALARMLQ